MNRLFVTRFNNKTWGENLRYNNKRQNCEYEKHCFNTCEHWEKFLTVYIPFLKLVFELLCGPFLWCYKGHQGHQYVFEYIQYRNE